MKDIDVPRISICPRCEGILTGSLTQAFTRGGYKVDLERCIPHQKEYIMERKDKGLCVMCDAGKGKHDRGCINE